MEKRSGFQMREEVTGDCLEERLEKKRRAAINHGPSIGTGQEEKKGTGGMAQAEVQSPEFKPNPTRRRKEETGEREDNGNQ